MQELALLDNQHGLFLLWRNQVFIGSHLLLQDSRCLMKGLVLQAGEDIFSHLSGALEDWISFLTLSNGFYVICGIGRQFYLLLDSCSQGRRRTLFLRGNSDIAPGNASRWFMLVWLRLQFGLK